MNKESIIIATNPGRNGKIKNPFLKNIMVSLVFTCVFLSTGVHASPEDVTRQGMEAFSEGDTIGAMRLYREAAGEGYAPAQEKLAFILWRSGDYEEAFFWYQKAAEQNNAEGQYGLGMMYLAGEGVEKDTERGLQLIRAAADQELFRAMRSMFYSYRDGQHGLPADPEQAQFWLQKMADSGNQWAINELAGNRGNGEPESTTGEENASTVENAVDKDPVKQ